ncbi:NAD(P)-binding domain-containing protein [Neorhizobium petrolearium]|uniref:NAD(P)-binding domain-containing protein n=1 Tax=Neorhizobium petrolearium TaxID=515361 RepID=UPI003F150E61
MIIISIGAGTMATAIAGGIATARHTVEVVNRYAAKARPSPTSSQRSDHRSVRAVPVGDIVILAVSYAGASAVVTSP